MQISQRLKPQAPTPPIFNCVGEERLYRKQHVAAVLRLFAKYGFDEDFSGHISARDPEYLDSFWVNPSGIHFNEIKASDLIRVNHIGEVVEGKNPVNETAEAENPVNENTFAIHSYIYAGRPDVISVVHTHSIYGKSWSCLGRELDPLSQDACAFYQHHRVYHDYTGAVLEIEEARRIAEALEENKAMIFQNHGLLTVGHSVDEAAWWFISLERICQAQLLAEAAGKPAFINHDSATLARHQVGSHYTGWSSFQPLYNMITRHQPDLLL
jgi:ribulose-5-phosphate 4-epimerase/fuculose-1-phosphate aldolase